MFGFSGRAGITLRCAGDMGPSSDPSVPARLTVLRELDPHLATGGSMRHTPADAVDEIASGDIASDAADWRTANPAILVLPQTHSLEVHQVDSSWLGTNLPEGDGMVTSDPAVVLGVTVADCLPIYLRDPRSGARGLVHSGWRGTGVAAVAVESLERNFGARRGDIEAFIGPGICGDCYEVGEDVYRHFLDGWGPDCVRRTADSHYVDLKAANEILLHRAGVEHLCSSLACTMESRAYSSFRRDGVGFVRMLAFFAD